LIGGDLGRCHELWPDMDTLNGSAEIAGVDNDGGKAQEVDNYGVDFTELS